MRERPPVLRSFVRKKETSENLFPLPRQTSRFAEFIRTLCFYNLFRIERI